MIKINVPFKAKEEVFPLIDAGANELYCGYLAPEWEREYTNLEFERKGGGSNFSDLKALGEAVEMAHSRNVPVALALNGLYVGSQYPLLRRILARVSRIPFDAYIVADMGLLLTLREMKVRPRLHISTGATVFNAQAGEFFRGLGASRIVLDRQASVQTMDTISRAVPDVEFEVFLLNTLCVYIDGFCTFMHTYGRKPQPPPAAGRRKGGGMRVESLFDLRAVTDACCLPYGIQTFDGELSAELGPQAPKPTFFKQLNDSIECGVCALYDIHKTGVGAVKIVGRQYDAAKRLSDTAFVKKALALLAREGIGRSEFNAQVQEMYRATYGYGKPCQGNNCYHPEVLR